MPSSIVISFDSPSNASTRSAWPPVSTVEAEAGPEATIPATSTPIKVSPTLDPSPLIANRP